MNQAEKRKQRKGLDYFNEQYEIDIYRKGAEPLKSHPDLEQPNNSIMTQEDAGEFLIKETKKEPEPVFPTQPQPLEEITEEMVKPIPVTLLDPVAREKEELQKQLEDIEHDFKTVQLGRVNNQVTQEVTAQPIAVEPEAYIKDKPKNDNRYKPDELPEKVEQAKSETDNEFFIAEENESDKDEEAASNKDEDSRSGQEDVEDSEKKDSQLIEFSKADLEEHTDNEKND